MRYDKQFIIDRLDTLTKLVKASNADGFAWSNLMSLIDMAIKDCERERNED